MRQQNRSKSALALAASLVSLLAIGVSLPDLGFGINSAQAAQKSAISPDVVAPSIDPVVEAAPEIVVPSIAIQAPAQAPAPVSIPRAIGEDVQPVVEIQPRSTSRRHLAVSIPRAIGEDVQPVVEIQPRSTSRRHLAKRTAPNRDRVDIVLESRSSGCRAVISGASSLESGLCSPKIPVASRRYATPDYAYVSAAGYSARVRALSDAELKALSRPSLGGKRMQFPLAIPAEISSSFGYRVHPITGAVRFHQGTDIAAAEGTPVLAAYSGTVEVAGWMGGLGLAVVISHGDRLETRYAHMSQLLVEPGQKITQGMPIGLVGSTGFSTGPHLHFEAWQKLGEEWIVMDPTQQLAIALENLNRYLAQIAKPQSRT